MGDPSSGARAMSTERFESIRANKLLFVIHNKQELARFNDPAEWRALPGAPLAAGVGNEGGGLLPWPKLGPTDN